MNDNYLWDKTESDAEIEKLENALQAFRYQESDAPALPAKTFQFEPKSSRRFFRFAFAFVACLAFVIISLGIWFGITKRDLTGGIETAEFSLPQNSDAADSAIKDKQEEIPAPIKVSSPPVQKSTTPARFVKTNFVQPKNFPSKGISARSLVAVKNELPKIKEVKLTRQEKYAYDQLMLALSITSSKLKFVKDKADGLEKPDSVYSDGKIK